MKLLTEEILKALPKIGETENDLDPLLICKFFYPDFGWTWYAIEFDGKDLFFGLVEGYERELGYFTLSELQKNKGQLGCSIERDRYFKPIRLSQLPDR